MLPLPPSQIHDASPHDVDGDPLQEVEQVFPKATDDLVGSQREPNPGDIANMVQQRMPITIEFGMIGNEAFSLLSPSSCHFSLETMCLNVSHNPT
jgi:hypothetical protein